MGATREEIAAELLKESKAVQAAESSYKSTERLEKVRLPLFLGPYVSVMLICHSM
jgi:hypothetical protein